MRLACRVVCSNQLFVFLIVFRSEFAPMVMERIANEFNKLQYNSKMVDHPLVEENKPVSRSVWSGW